MSKPIFELESMATGATLEICRQVYGAKAMVESVDEIEIFCAIIRRNLMPLAEALEKEIAEHKDTLLLLKYKNETANVFMAQVVKLQAALALGKAVVKSDPSDEVEYAKKITAFLAACEANKI